MAYVAGNYRGRYLKLDSFEQLREEPGKVGGRSIYTRLILSVNRRPEAVVSPIDHNPSTGPIASEKIGQMLTSVDLSALRGRVSLEARATQIYYEQPRIETDIAYLEWLLDVLDKLADSYTQIIALGGQAAPALEEIIKVTALELQNAAAQLLQGIAADTEKRLRYRLDRLLCPYCLTHYTAHKASTLAWQPLTYYGCRICRQSREFMEGQVIAALDRRMSQEWSEQDKTIRINWLARRKLFDFDAVAIIQASDEEVERFAVQVGNDTDPYRRLRYKQMRCSISTACDLSRNSRRILEYTFGQIEKLGLEVET